MPILLAAACICTQAAAQDNHAQAGRPPIVVVPPATIDDGLQIRGEEVAARRDETRMTVAVHVNGEGPFNFVVDSGADRSVVGATLAARLRLPRAASLNLVGIANMAVVPAVTVARLRMGSTEIIDLHAPALAERDLGADGLLGIDALAEQRLMLDFQRQRVTIEDARRRMPTLPGDIVVTARRQRGQLIITRVVASGRPTLALIDSGSMVTIGNQALLRKLTGGRRSSRTRHLEIIDVTGAKRTVPVVIVHELRIGILRLTGVAIAFADLPPFERFGLSQEPALLLGTDLLRGFAQVSLDFRRRKVRFQLRPTDGANVILR